MVAGCGETAEATEAEAGVELTEVVESSGGLCRCTLQIRSNGSTRLEESRRRQTVGASTAAAARYCIAHPRTPPEKRRTYRW